MARFLVIVFKMRKSYRNKVTGQWLSIYILVKRYTVSSLLLLLLVTNQKVRLSLCSTKHHAMETYWLSGGAAPHILNLRARWRWVVSFTPPASVPPCNHWIGGWVDPRAGPDAVAKRKIPSSRHESNPDRPSRSLVSTPTELSRLL
jgi:hypothetical protein